VTKVFVTKRGGMLIAADDETRAVLDRIKDGTDLSVEIKRARNLRFHRLLIKLLDTIVSNTDKFENIEKALLAVKKILLGQVDLFIHYFRDYLRFAEVFGLSLDCHEFVPFKVNLGSRQADWPEQPEGDYVLCFGRSLRDYDTFFEAMEKLPYPAAIARPDMAGLEAHHARFTRSLDRLPANVRILEDEGSELGQIRILGNAKIVVLPILKASLVASGISTCLNAMQLGKCVVGSEGPGMSDIFTDEIISVPPEDPDALAAAITQVWEDPELRLKTARAGHLYAQKVGGEADLYQRIVDRIVLWYRRGGERTRL